MKNFFKELNKFFSGRKAYIVGLIMIGSGIYLKDNSLVLEGLGIITLRAGISKLK